VRRRGAAGAGRGPRSRHRGAAAYASINELYGSQEKYLLLELEVPAGLAGETREVATVDVAYADTSSKTVDRVQGGRAYATLPLSRWSSRTRTAG